MSASRAAVLESPPQGQQKQVPRWPRWLLRAAIAFVILTAIGVAVFLLRFPFSRDRVRQSLEETFHGQVAFVTFRNTYFPHPGCVAEGLTLVHPLSPSGSPPLVSVSKFTLQAHYIYLLVRPGYVSRVTLEGLHIQVPDHSSGRPVDKTETPSKAHIAEVIANNALLEVARDNGKEPLRYDIHTLTLHSVTRWKPFAYDATLLNALPPGEIESHGHFGPWNSHDPGATPVSGTYKFDRANLNVFPGIGGTLSSHDNFNGMLKQIETNGAVDVPDFKVTRAARSVPLHASYHAFVDSFNGDVRLEHVDTSVVKTELLARGSFTGRPGQHGKTTSLEVNVNEGRIQDLLRIFVKEPRSPFSGLISFRAHVEVPPRGRPFLSEVILKGDFGIEGGQFTKAKTQESIATLSERAQGNKADEKHKDEEKNGGAQKASQTNGDEDEPERVISNLAGHVELKNGVATFTNLSFGIPGAVAYAHGTFNLLNDRIDLHGSMKTDANFTKVAGGGIKSIFLKPFDAIFKKEPKGAEIPVRLTGTYSDPHPGIELGGGKNAVKKEKETKDEKE